MNQSVSVVIPAYNGSAYLADAIDSVHAQTLAVKQIIVVDDASTDHSSELAEKLGCTCIRLNKNHGVAHARNIGIKQSTGDYIAFLDQDDRWLPEKLRLQVQAMVVRPELEFTCTHLFHFLECEQVPQWAREDWFRKPAPGFTPSTLVVRKDVFLTRGLFSTDCISSSDTNWIIGAKIAGAKFEMLSQCHVERRIHDGNVSRDPDLRRELLLEMARAIRLKRLKSVA